MTANGTRQTFAGVVTVPQASVHQSIREQVDQALRGVKAGKTMAILTVHTGSGANLAVAHKFNDHFEVISWVGKSGWDKPVTGGVAITYSR